MLSLEEREERKKQIGASEIHKLFNFDSQEAQDLWELKIGLQEYQELDSDAITAGNILEEDCLKYYEKTNNIKLIYNARIHDIEVDGLVVSLDAYIPNDTDTLGIPVENKVINEKTWISWIAKRSGNAEYDGIKINIPKSYYYQLQTQIYVLDSNEGVLNINTLTDEEQEDPINVTITDLHNKQIHVKRDNKVIEEIVRRAKYMLHCMKYKIRPSELDYLEKEVF